MDSQWELPMPLRWRIVAYCAAFAALGFFEFWQLDAPGWYGAVALVRRGMSRAEVEDILGPPTVLGAEGNCVVLRWIEPRSYGAVRAWTYVTIDARDRVVAVEYWPSPAERGVARKRAMVRWVEQIVSGY